MPKFIVRLSDKKKNKDYFILWSTIVDGSVGHFDGLKDAIAYLKRTLIPTEFVRSSMALLSKGVSNPNYTIDDILDSNDENCETVEELINKYCE